MSVIQRIDIKKVLLLSVVTFATYLFCAAYHAEDEVYTLFDVVFLRRDLLKNVGRESYYFNPYSEWFEFAMPILFPVLSVTLLCEELKSGTSRYSELRVGKGKFFRDVILSALLTSLIIYMISYLLFEIFVLVAVPPASEEVYVVGESASEMVALGMKGIGRTLIQIVFVTFMSLMMAFLSKDKYVAVTIPFIVYYMMSPYYISEWVYIGLIVIMFWISEWLMERGN